MLSVGTRDRVRTAGEGSSSSTDHATRATRTISCITGWLGSLPAILLSLGAVAAWFVGSFFVTRRLANNTYQLVINTGTTIVTFLMVFVIQNTQNRDGRAIQAKLDAQAEALASIAQHLGLEEHDEVLLDLVGVEDAPERKIAAKQESVREAAKSQGD